MKKIVFLLALFSSTTQAQDFRSHQWKNRLILVYSDSFDEPRAQRQLELLFSEPEELSERNIVVYQLTPLLYRKGSNGKVTRFKKPKEVSPEFKVELIGLDGRSKYSSDKVESLQTFNLLIDQMPMRIAELEGRGGK